MDKDIKFYKTVIGEWLAIEQRDGCQDKLYFSANGKRFFQLYIGGLPIIGGKATSYTIEYPHFGKNWTGVIKSSGIGYVLNVPESQDEPFFTPVENPTVEVEFVAIPLVMKLMGVYTLPDGQYMVWTQSKYDHPYTQVHLYFGDPDDLKEYIVAKASENGVVTPIATFEPIARRFGGYALRTRDEKQYELKISIN